MIETNVDSNIICLFSNVIKLLFLFYIIFFNCY